MEIPDCHILLTTETCAPAHHPHVQKALWATVQNLLAFLGQVGQGSFLPVGEWTQSFPHTRHEGWEDFSV